jgi:glycosyltransferase involved in cell wall biosynthesis
MTTETPRVSICIFTFNYENYLSQAIDSVLGQTTSFPIEIIIGDDCSTDATRQIAENYCHEHPDIIRLSFHETNKGGTFNWIHTMNQCKGDYIALLDGDDYFTDRYKLQKQFDALENDKNAVLCFHAVEEKYDDIEGIDKIVRFEKPVYTLEDFLTRGWFIRTGSSFLRNHILPEQPPAWVFDYPYRYDTIMHVFLGEKGHAVYIDEVMSVWRKHRKGMSYALMEKAVKNSCKEIELANQLNKHTAERYNTQVKRYCALQYAGLCLQLLKKGLFLKHPALLGKSLAKMNYGYFGLHLITFIRGRIFRMG